MDPEAFRATKAGDGVALEPKALEVLLFLLENPGRLVEKRELLERVWPDTVVTESALTRVIADLRRALGDPAHGARYIETVPTKGYRFIAPVRKGPEGTGASPARREGESVAASRRAPPRLLWLGAALGALAALAGGLATLWRERVLPVRPAETRPVHQVTDSLGLDLFPTFSPDGAQIAYASERGSGYEIFVRQLAAGSREIQVTSDGQDNVQPAWSPDGREIAYVSRGRPGIWLVPALGGTPRRLTAFGSRPAWSPDGTRLAFQSTALQDVSASAPAAISPASLFLVPASGGTPVPLTRPGSPPGGHGAPAFSPDGRTIVFSTWSMHDSALWGVSPLDGSLRRISPREGGAALIYYETACAPRGDWIYFTATAGSWLNATLWRVHVPSRPEESWGEPERVAPAGPASMRQVAISPRDGSSIAYAALSGVSNIWSLKVDPRTAGPVGRPVLLTRAASSRNAEPRFSPDGSGIAFISYRAGARSEVWVIDTDGQNARQLTNYPAGSYQPDWFPDGKRIAFLSKRRGSTALWSLTLADRSEKELLPVDDEVAASRLSPDGRRLALTVPTAGVRNVWIAPLDDGTRRQVTFDREGAGYACWSPDGRYLALELHRGTDMPLAIVPAAGGEPVIVTREPGLSWPHDWSPDSERILFAGKRDGIWNVYWISRRGGSEHRLTDYTSRSSYVRYPAWSPRGDRIAYEYTETTGNIWLMALPR